MKLDDFQSGSLVDFQGKSLFYLGHFTVKILVMYMGLGQPHNIEGILVSCQDWQVLFHAKPTCQVYLVQNADAELRVESEIPMDPEVSMEFLNGWACKLQKKSVALTETGQVVRDILKFYKGRTE